MKKLNYNDACIYEHFDICSTNYTKLSTYNDSFKIGNELQIKVDEG